MNTLRNKNKTTNPERNQEMSEQAPNPGRPVEEYSVDELFNHEERQAREQREQEWVGYLEKRYDAAETSPGKSGEPEEYEDMSVSQLANKLGEAIGYEDRTTAGNVGDVLTHKVDELVEQSRSDKDSEHNDLREQQIRDRIAGIAFRRAEEIKSQIGSTEESAEDQDVDQDHKEVLKEEQPTEPLDEPEKVQEQEDLESAGKEEQVPQAKTDRMTNIRGAASKNPLKLGAMAAGVGMPSNPDYRHGNDGALPEGSMTLKELGYYGGKSREKQYSKFAQAAKRFGSWAVEKATYLAPEQRRQAKSYIHDVEQAHEEALQENRQRDEGVGTDDTAAMPTPESSKEKQIQKAAMPILVEKLKEMNIGHEELSVEQRMDIGRAILEQNNAENWTELHKRRNDSAIEMPDEATIRAILDKKEQ